MSVADDRRRGSSTRWLEGFNSRVPVSMPLGGPPLPGDEVLREFVLYPSSALKGKVGSGSLVCRYSSRTSAICDASFELVDGSKLTATGIVESDPSKYSLALTGGSGNIVSQSGDVEGTSVTDRVQRLEFRFA